MAQTIQSSGCGVNIASGITVAMDQRTGHHQDARFEGDRPLLTELSFPVKTYDIDFAGHVSNISYIRWLEDLRLALLESYLPLQPQMESGTVPMVAETSIRYRRQVELFQTVRGCMWIESVGTVRAKLRAEFTVGGVVCADATQIGAFVDTRSGRPARVPEALRCLFSNEA